MDEEKIIKALETLEEIVRFSTFISVGFSCDIEEKFPSSCCQKCNKSIFCEKIYRFKSIMEDLQDS